MHNKFCKKLYLLGIVCLLVFIPCLVFAETGGGTGGSGGGSGGTSYGGAYYFYQRGGSNAVTSASYKMELAYFDKAGNKEVLSTKIVQGNCSEGSEAGFYSLHCSDAITAAREYAKRISVDFVDNSSNPLVGLANTAENGNVSSEYFGSTKENYKKIKNFINNGFGVADSKMTKEHDTNPGRYDSFGYRIVIQKLTLYGYNSGNDRIFAAPRKEVAKELKSTGGYYSYIDDCVQLFGGLAGYTKELYTEQDDVHIRKGSDFKGNIGIYNNTSASLGFNHYCASGMKTWSYSGSEDKTDYLADEHNGLGYNILWFDTTAFNSYDYSLDAACVNCQAKNFGNKAYVIQDTTDWEAILNSSSQSTVENAKTYYKKDSDVYCREEYTVKFPDVNSSNFIANVGMYFTVNATDKELKDIPNIIHNFKPITVTRTRQCKSASGNTAALSNFEKKSKGSFKDNAGTVKLKYTETGKKNSRYNVTVDLVKNSNASNEYKSNISSGMLTMSQTVSYTLNKNVYRYVRLSDGLSIYNSSVIDKEELKTKYKDLGIANLPISYNNSAKGGTVAANVQLSYELPNDGYSKIKTAYTKENDYFKSSSNKTKDNIYAKARKAGAFSNKNSIQKGSLSDNDYDALTQSACAKLYKTANGYNSGVSACASDREKNKIGDSSNCVKKNDIENTNSGYICPIRGDSDETGDCKTEEDAKKLGYDWDSKTKTCSVKACTKTTAKSMGRDWNSTTSSCCKVGEKYDSSTGTCVPSTDGCTKSNAKSMGRDWNSKTNKCCPVGSHYNSNSGKCEIDKNKCNVNNYQSYNVDWNYTTSQCCNPGETYNQTTGTCDSTPDNPPTECPTSRCPYGCCPSGICAPMPRDKNGNVVCPSGSGNKVIYRTIDLANPFPGQSAKNRATGSNWCSYNIKTQKLSCKYNNATATNYIISGASSNTKSSKTYSSNHILYKVTLDSKTISNIRKYNDKNKYDDFTLSCKDNGNACISQFLKTVVTTTGKCANKSTKDGFNSCNS